jgi:hypothetical protein
MLSDSKLRPFDFRLFDISDSELDSELPTNMISNCYYWERCLCSEEFLSAKSVRNDFQRKGRAFEYPKERYHKTFEIKYTNKLSLKAKYILNSFNYKYIYYAIDDILYLLKSDPTEKENLLTVLYSSILSLHNSLEINFFDIWIESIYINETSKNNRFFKGKDQSKSLTHITLKLLYRTRAPFKKPESLW